MPIFGVRVAGRLYCKVLQQLFACSLGFPISGGDTNVKNAGNPRIAKNPIQAENGTLGEEDGLVRTHARRTDPECAAAAQNHSKGCSEQLAMK